MAKKVVSVSMDEDLWNEFDEFAKRLNLNRSQALQMMLTAMLRGEGTNELLGRMILGGNKIDSKKESDESIDEVQFLA